MNTFKKIIALALATTVLGTMLLSCKGEPEQETDPNAETNSNRQTEGTTETETEVITEVKPTVAENDYGDTLYIEVSGSTSDLYAKEDKGDVVSAALYDRQEKVRDYLGVEVIASQAEGTYETYHQAFCRSVKNKDGAIDVLISHFYMAIPMIVSTGYARDLKTVDSLNLDADYWNTSYMESLALYDRYYLGYSDFNIPETHLIAYNKDMLEMYSDSLDESIYDTVRNYRWTVDRMISLAKLVYIDTTSDGKSEDDTFGITGRQWFPFVGFLHASNIQLVEENDAGDYVVSVYSEKNREKTTALVDKLRDLAFSESAWFNYRAEETPEVKLESGRTLMTIVTGSYTQHYLETDLKFGVLPFPMFDEAQKDVGYRSLNCDGYIVFPSYLDDENMVGDTVEMMAFYSEPVRVAFYEKLLGKQVADTPDDREMMDLIWDGICSDFGMTYSTITLSLDKNLYMLPTLTGDPAAQGIASYVESYEGPSNKQIKKFMKDVKNQK